MVRTFIGCIAMGNEPRLPSIAFRRLSSLTCSSATSAGSWDKFSVSWRSFSSPSLGGVGEWAFSLFRTDPVPDNLSAGAKSGPPSLVGGCGRDAKLAEDDPWEGVEQFVHQSYRRTTVIISKLDQGFLRPLSP